MEYQVRLRHVQGDLGPFTLPAETTVAELSELAYVEWPEGMFTCRYCRCSD